MKLINTIYAPQESVNDDYLSLVSLYVKTGDFVTKNLLLAEVETSKAIVEIHCDSDGYIVVHVEAGTDVRVGGKMFDIFDSPGTEISPSIANNHVDALAHDNANTEPAVETKFSKQALEYIEKNNVNLSRFNGLAFVTTKDIAEATATTTGNRQEPANNQRNKTPDKVKETNPSEKTIKAIAPSKKKEFEYLYSVNSSSVISRLSVAIQIGNKENIAAAQNFIQSTPLPTIVHEVSKLLIKYPNLNSFYFEDKQAFYSDRNIGFAVDDGKNGLKVACIFKADSLSLKAIEDNITDLLVKYGNQQLTVHELSSATFTITDLFGTNVLSFHPLVNSNNSSILGISGYHNGEFIVDLSFDHRLTSGKEVSLFLEDLKFRLEARFNAKEPVKEIADKDIHCLKCLRPLSDDLDGRVYFQKVINSRNSGYICSNCLTGF